MYVCVYVSYRSVLLYQDSGPHAELKHVAALTKRRVLVARSFPLQFPLNFCRLCSRIDQKTGILLVRAMPCFSSGSHIYRESDFGPAATPLITKPHSTS